MTGPSCHAGGGISVMGTITANVMLEDFRLKDKNDPLPTLTGQDH
jgi:hypothetical protein